MKTNIIDIEDIKQRIESDFGSRCEEARKLINAAIHQASHIDHPRIIRCILFLSEGSINKLKKNIDSAVSDPRDVMFWAEYINRSELPSRIRDFNKTFDACESGVRE
jgi:hypothetical protein